MKDELNTYGILNSDGTAQPVTNEGKVSYDNDSPNFIRESATSDLGEMAHVTETFDDPKDESEGDSLRDYSEQDLSSSTSSSASSASSSASASASTASAASASVGGGLGALAGVVATSVVAAVVVVAAFISSLVISLSLVMADMFSLTFEVTMTGADERDFEQPMYAVLTGEDDFYREQPVTADTTLLIFDDLEPGKEYRLRIRNEEKIFAEVTAFTTTEPNEKGEIVSHMQGTNVSVMVKKAELKNGEYYTLIAKDTEGNVVFSKDGVDPFVEYTFTVDAPKDLTFYLMVGGKAYAVSQTLVPSYDFDHGVWTWDADYSAATVTFADTRGGEALVFTASVTRKTTDATCEQDGSIVYTAKVEYDGKTYSNKQTTVLDALGHDYDGVYEAGQITYTCSRCHDSYTSD